MTTSHLFGNAGREQTSAPDDPAAAFNVWTELQALRQAGAWKNGSARKTLAVYPEFRIDLIALTRGSAIPRHVNAGRIAVQCVTGIIHFHTDERTFDLPAGEVLVVGPRVWHAVEAPIESAFLLTVSLPKADVPALFNSGRWIDAPDAQASRLATPVAD